MNDNFENSSFEQGYNTYRFTMPSEPEQTPEESVQVEPAPVEPTPVESAPVEPTPVESASVESAPVHQTPVEPALADQISEESAQPKPMYTNWSTQGQAETKGQDSTYAYSFRKATPEPPVSPRKPEIPKKTATPKKKKSSGGFKKFAICIGLAAVFGLVASGVFLGVTAAGIDLLGLEASGTQNMEIPKVDTVGPASGNTTNAAEASAEIGNLTVAQVAERCMPAMVAITNKSIQEVPNFFGFGSQNYESTSSGSGIIVDQNDQELLIATNNHVVSGATSLTVCFIDEVLVEAMIKGTDPENDLAVISVKLSDIPAETLEQIKVIAIGDSDDLAVGDQVVAIGNALGYGQSVSSGWISALNREVTIDNITLNLIQTDAAINPGNSGGALLNMKGELIAINESKYADTTVEGMGYAIPVSTATPILSELMSKTTRYKVDEAQASYLGVSCLDLSAEFISMYGVPSGVYVDSVEENGPAAAAGIKKGDLIIKFDGTRLSSYTDLVGQLEYYAAGETVEVTICRADDGEYKERVVTVTLGSRNDTDFLDGNVE